MLMTFTLVSRLTKDDLELHTFFFTMSKLLYRYARALDNSTLCITRLTETSILALFIKIQIIGLLGNTYPIILRYIYRVI